MNIIIDPQGLRTAAKGETMPRRKYFFAAVHIEFMVFKGKQEVYEISLICQDMSSIEVFIVPEAMKNDTATLEALGFTLNRNLNKYFYVQSGTGMTNIYFNFFGFRKTIFYFAFNIVTDRTFGSAELLLCGSAQMTELFSAEHRTFFRITFNAIGNLSHFYFA